MTRRVSGALHILAAGTLLVLAGLVSGHFAIFFDTGGYIRQGEWLASRLHLADRIGFYDLMSIVPGLASTKLRPFLSVIDARSPAYSLFLYLGCKVGTFVFVAWLQGLAAAWPISVAARIAIPSHRWGAFWAVIAVLAVGSSLPFFVDFAMPDVFGGLAILCAALLLGASAKLGRFETVGLWVLLAFSVSVHKSNLGTIAALTALGVPALLALRRPPGVVLAKGAAVVAALVLCVGSAAVSKRMLEHDTQVRTGSPPFLTARVLADGAGRDYLAKACPGGVAPTLCRFKNLPLDNTDKILWDIDPAIGVFNASDYATRIKLQDEQMKFVVASVLTDPLLELKSALGNWAKQLVLVTVDEPLQDPGRYIAGDHPDTPTIDILLPGTLACWKQKECYSHTLKTTLTIVHSVVLVLSTLMIVWAAFVLVRESRAFAATEMIAHGLAVRDTAWLLFAGIILNAAVCGIVSEPFARYQARIVWLVPMTAVLGVLFVRLYVRQRTAASAPAPGTQIRLEPV